MVVLIGTLQCSEGRLLLFSSRSNPLTGVDSLKSIKHSQTNNKKDNTAKKHNREPSNPSAPTDSQADGQVKILPRDSSSFINTILSSFRNIGSLRANSTRSSMAKTGKLSKPVKNNKHDLKRKEYEASYRQLQSQDTRSIYHPLLQKGFNQFRTITQVLGRFVDKNRNHFLLGGKVALGAWIGEFLLTSVFNVWYYWSL